MIKDLQFEVINIARKYITLQFKIEGETQQAKIEKLDLLRYIPDITLNKEYITPRRIVYNFFEITQ